MPAFTISTIADALNERGKPLKGSKVLSLGIAYKRDTNDVRESPALQVLEGLIEKGASVYFSDPYVQSILLKDQMIKAVELTPELIQSVDCVAILTDHSSFDYAMVAKFSALILDTRNAMKGFSRPNLILL
jgi:UDP-N-acetyl-D-glucosamine dehydrogenase